jgi:hypothetical protein
LFRAEVENDEQGKYDKAKYYSEDIALLFRGTRAAFTRSENQPAPSAVFAAERFSACQLQDSLFYAMCPAPAHITRPTIWTNYCCHDYLFKKSIKM